MTESGASRASVPPAGTSASSTTTGRDLCHVISHVHWDREWYRGFDGYRGRLVELVERVCDALDDDTYASFHLDGQTVVLADVLEIRPDLEPRLSDLIVAGRLTVGPWHVLADNQLVSAENLVRNLFRARRWGNRIGRLSTVGYSPDAFGHPADLPRLLAGFGMDTALVWRGAPPELGRFRWRSPDGSEVFTVNQSYHQTEVLWAADTSGGLLRDYVDAERTRLPEGPWLLLNGGDHVVPRPPSRRTGATAGSGVALVETTLEAFFELARRGTPGTDAAPLAVVNGELRTLGNRLTFLLPGTLSARTYVKLANERVQTLLERFVEPQLARLQLAELQRARPQRAQLAGGSASANGFTSAGSQPRSLAGLLDHAWDLVIKNAPHDSICGCSIDEVHRATTVRAERAKETGELLVQRFLLAEGLDTRRYGTPPVDRIDLVVLSGQGDDTSGAVVVELATDAARGITALRTTDGAPISFEVESTRIETVFEADLDLMPDSRECAIHRVAFRAADVPAFGWRAYTAELGDAAATAQLPTSNAAASQAPATQTPVSQPGASQPAAIESGRFLISANADASLSVHDRATGVRHDKVGLLVSNGDRGDSYNYDPPAVDLVVHPTTTSVTVTQTEVRTRILIKASMLLPEALAEDRESRSSRCIPVPLTVAIEHWAATDRLDWTVAVDNRVDDHRLRFEVPLDPAATLWTADQHWSAITRPIGPDLGALPTERGLEAEHGVAPVHSWASAGTGGVAVAVLTRGLPELQASSTDGSNVLAVTLLRAVGWMSRFDLRTRTTGAGPMLPVPEAQCHGVLTAHLAVIFGHGAESGSITLPMAAARHRVPLLAYALRPAATPPAARSAAGNTPRVTNALVSTWKPLDETTAGHGTVLRIGNPTPLARTATVTLPTGVGTVERARIDETVLAAFPVAADGTLAVELGPFSVQTLILRTGGPSPRT
ncbi:glycoside hydrolase family 38 C-terminal domain-containing protein [Cryobacterium sp. Y50]|uniref:glycoside hydrolase family 38 N-terminal domain-containing protein n=1 Tax=Cryobacterium sp. Y50 TaxID=2048286 RepID=UPI001304E779|nr:glycoside hydrolase family 38 C-terminal domain-containing protein [Cryobacterium sp. Y50]